MNKINYDQKMQEQIKLLKGQKAKLLIHSCCAPCSSACLYKLIDYFEISVLYYNPNVTGEEYNLRKAEQQRFLKETGWANFIDCDHDEQAFYSAVLGLENQPEGGSRCRKCFELRLKKTRDIAENGGFDFFATTLTVSPLKNSALINDIGLKLQTEKIKWLCSDFKKRNGYLLSCELSKKYNLYRQNYCGCTFSQKSAQKVEK